MKNVILILIMLCCMNAFSQTEKSIVKSEVKEVRIFLTGAQVTRVFKTSVEAGITQLVVEKLSPKINQNSITATINGDAMILSTGYSLDYLKEDKMTPQLKKLKDSLEVLNDELAGMNMVESVYNEEIAMLNSNKAVGGNNVGVNAENLQKVIDFYRKRMIELKSKILELDKQEVKLNEKIKKINEQIVEENGRMNQPYGTILMNISARQRTAIEIEFSYYANGANWRPSYDLRAKDVNSQVSLNYKASVMQFTGEDWENVSVTLSTGNPSLGGNKPDLIPWYLRFMQMGYRNQAAPVSQDKEKFKLRGAGADSIVNFADDNSSSVTMVESQIVTEFEIKIPYTIRSDGKEVMMDIQSFSLPATFSYFTTPKLDKDAFLMASITGWEKLNLLPGNSNVYLENSYVGQSYINPQETKDTLKLSFGRDKRIVIRREKVKDLNTTKFIGGNVEKEFLFETTIRNTKKDAITITVEDQVPLTTDADIKISNGELSGGQLNSETGMVTWKMDILPGETKKIRLGFRVKYPKDKSIPGL